MLQQYVARDITRPHSRQVGGVAVSVTRAGLPRIIPRIQRVLIRRGEVRAVKFWLSMLNIYRYLESTHNMFDSYKTITQRGPELELTSDLYKGVRLFWAALCNLVGKKLVMKGLGKTKPFIFQSVSVAIRQQEQITGSSLWATVLAIHGWRAWTRVWSKQGEDKFFDRMKAKKLAPALGFLIHKLWPEGLVALLGNIFWSPSGPSESNSVGPVGEVGLVNPRTTPRSAWVPPNTDLVSRGGIPLGRLVQLKEAAGKVRVIAIVDPITNWVLKPIHEWLFSILKLIPQDGTFDQEAPVKKVLAVKASDKFIGSADMSAATDRLPVSLQELLLAHVLGKHMAKAWRILLTYRPYKTSGFKNIWYAVGQPMGALSSWAMLAITHHFLWQWSAWRSGFTPWGQWFKLYAVLGDDSISRIRSVVDEYLKICSELGVKVNLFKSLLSPIGAVEFAKRFFTPKGDCSPISFGELFVSRVNFSVMSNWPRKHRIRVHDLLYIMGYKHRVTGALEKRLVNLPKKVQHMIIVLRSPWGAYPLDSFTKWLGLVSFDRIREVDVQWPGIVLLGMVLDLHKKAEKVVLANALPLSMYGIGADALTARVRHIDPKTAIAVSQVVYEPVRKEIFKDATKLRSELGEFAKDLRRNAFLYDVHQLDHLMEMYFSYEDRLHNLHPRAYEQSAQKPFVPPSPRSIVKLRNRFLTGNASANAGRTIIHVPFAYALPVKGKPYAMFR